MPGFGIGMIHDDFHIAGIRQVAAERLKRAVMYSMGTKRIQPARGWWATVPQSGGTTVQIVSTYPASPEARPPRFLGKPAVRPSSMAGGAPTPCGRH